MCALAILFSRPVPYAGAAALQERLVEARVADRLPDMALLLEHEPVITLGVRARPSHVLLSPDELKARGIALVRSSRGGDVTFHGPGQWVLYPIVKLDGRPETSNSHYESLQSLSQPGMADLRAVRQAFLPVIRNVG
ncbi:MAG: hypothetical protein HY343_04055, partial [Lentisphaerae bacterium]|nr:hypothetical protein [Lentisphaerota bacterium]